MSERRMGSVSRGTALAPQVRPLLNPTVWSAEQLETSHECMRAKQWERTQKRPLSRGA